MTNDKPFPLGALLLRGLVLPLSLVAWVTVIVLAVIENPSEPRTTAFDTLTRVLLSGNQ
jgi:hypothetical protein